MPPTSAGFDSFTVPSDSGADIWNWADTTESAPSSSGIGTSQSRSRSAHAMSAGTQMIIPFHSGMSSLVSRTSVVSAGAPVVDEDALGEAVCDGDGVVAASSASSPLPHPATTSAKPTVTIQRTTAMTHTPLNLVNCFDHAACHDAVGRATGPHRSRRRTVLNRRARRAGCGMG